MMIRFQEELIAAICAKKELQSLDVSYVYTQIEEVLREEQLTLKKYENLANQYVSFEKFKRSAQCKKIISLTRKKLRVAYGVYVKKPLMTFEKLVSQLDSFCDAKIEKILLSHQSSQERFIQYSGLYERLFEELFSLGLAKSFSLMDLACGYNPFSYCYLPQKPTNYLAVDLSSEDMSLVNLFFTKTAIVGRAHAFSLLSKEFHTWFVSQKVDLCFFLKTLDSIEQKKRHYSKKLLADCPAKFIVVSFPLVSISGKPVDAQVRGWVERFIQKENWSYSSFTMANELFYVIAK